MNDHGSRPKSAARAAIETLAEAARARLARHPLGHLAGGRPLRLELSLAVPLGFEEEELAAAESSLSSALEGEIEALLAHRAAFRPGQVLSLRQQGAEPEHVGPAQARQVFVGFGPTGRPRFQDFDQWLQARQDPRVDLLYRQPPQLLTEIVSGRELTADLLPAFHQTPTDFRIHGQVVAGWFRLPGSGRADSLLALTFQVVSSVHRNSRKRRLALNVLGAGPDGEPLQALYDRLGGAPWRPVVQWAQSVLDSIERSQGRKNAKPAVLSHRIEGLLNGLARRLERGRRARERRTGHAEARHSTGERPTRMAMTDLARATPDKVLRDNQRQTLIVLGERGRAHVFNRAGKLVTSIRYTPDAIARKKERRRWRQASREELAQLRQRTGTAPQNGEAVTPAPKTASEG